MSYRCAEHSGDAAAYALGALEPQEARAFAEHAHSCIVCRDELEAFAQVTDALAQAVPQQRAPRRLRRAVLGEVNRSARLATASARDRDRARAPARGRMRGSFRRASPVAAGALVAALAAVFLFAGGRRARTPAPAPSRTIAAAVHAAHGRASLELADGRAELVVHDLPAPARGDIYEVWLRRGAATTPEPTTALFGVTGAGDGTVAVPGDLRSVTEVLVTEEPAGGTRVPTTAPVIMAQLA